jgi:hypothetical protein
MTDNQFDDIFKKRLENFDSQVPDDMWQRINKKDKDRKVFFIPRWYWLALLFLFVGVGGYFILNNNTNEKVGNNLSKTENAINGKTNENKPPKEILNKKSIAGNDTDNDKTAVIKNTNNIIKTTSKIIKQKKLVNNSTSFSSNQISANNDIISTNQDHNANEIVMDKSNHTDSNTIKLSVIKKSATDSSATVDENNNDPKKDDEENLDKFSLELYASPDFPFNSISSDDKSYEQALKDAGKMQLSYSVGARLRIRINKSWAAKIGVQYSQVNEKMNFVDSTLSSRNASHKNRYKSVDIPLLLVYTKKWSESFNTSVNAGVLLNITSKYKGAIPDPYGDAMHIDNTNIYKKNTGVNLFLGIDLSKQLNNRTDIFTEPYFRYRIKSITTDMQSFDQKINAIGISFGVRYRLFKKQDE